MNGAEKKEELETTPLIVTLVYVPPTGRSFRQANDHDRGGGEEFLSAQSILSWGYSGISRLRADSPQEVDALGFHEQRNTFGGLAVQRCSAFPGSYLIGETESFADRSTRAHEARYRY